MLGAHLGGRPQTAVDLELTAQRHPRTAHPLHLQEALLDVGHRVVPAGATGVRSAVVAGVRLPHSGQACGGLGGGHQLQALSTARGPRLNFVTLSGAQGPTAPGLLDHPGGERRSPGKKQAPLRPLPSGPNPSSTEQKAAPSLQRSPPSPPTPWQTPPPAVSSATGCVRERPSSSQPIARRPPNASPRVTPRWPPITWPPPTPTAAGPGGLRTLPGPLFPVPEDHRVVLALG